MCGPLPLVTTVVSTQWLHEEGALTKSETAMWLWVTKSEEVVEEVVHDGASL